MSEITYNLVQVLVDMSPLLIVLYFIITAIKGFVLFIKSIIEK